MSTEKQQVVQASESNPLAFIPLVAWKLVTGLFLFFIFLCFLANGYYHHASVNDFMSNGLGTFFLILKVLAGVIVVGVIYAGYQMFHHGMLHKAERTLARETARRATLQNRMLEAKIAATEQLPVMMKYAMDSGFNVKFGGLEVSNYLSNIHALGGPAGTTVQQLAMPGDYIPEPYTFSQVLQNWQPSKDGILLAKGRDLIIVPPGESLCHTTFTGNTDAGKTNNERMLIIQLAFLGQCIYLADRNYQPFREDRKRGTFYDYTPIEKHLAVPPIVTTAQAVRLLQYLYSVVEDRRMERRKAQTANAIVPFKDKYLFFDELPAFAGEDDEIMILIGRLLREARQYGVFFIGAAQDLLNQTLNNDNGAIRDNLLTNYYGGGDMTTAKLVLNLAKGMTIDETGLGKMGVVYLRAKGADIERVKCRAPLSDNEATILLLGDRQPVREVESYRPTTQPLREQLGYGSEMKNFISPEMSVNTEPEMKNFISREEAEVRRLLTTTRMTDTEIIEYVWKVKAGGSSSFKTAREKFKQMKAEIMEVQA